MRVVMVTGGTGFSGSNFIRYFLQTYDKFIIINYDNLDQAENKQNIQDLEGNPRYCFIKGDICDSEKVNKIIKKYDPWYLVNFAVEGVKSKSEDTLFFGTNVLGTLNLIQCVKNYWDGRDLADRLFLQVSTDQDYTDLGKIAPCFSEKLIFRPEIPYSVFRANAELMGRTFSQAFNFPLIITRCCKNYGPYQGQEEFIPSCILKALRGEAISIYGEGTNISEWIYVQDHCSALAQILFKGQPGEVYKIGSGEEASNLEIARIVLRNVGREGGFVREASEVNNSQEWQCNYSLEEGIRETIKWYKENYF